MSLLLVDRFHPHLRHEVQAVIDAGRLRKRDELALFAEEQMLPLARLSLLLFVIGGMFFIILDLALYAWRMYTPAVSLTFGGVLLWIGANILGYLVILPIHEAIHGLAFAFWGGRPHFGTKLPLALYCGAKGQVFRRDQYLVVGLAPLLVITLAAIILTLFWPAFASYTILASAGNIAGAAGDIMVVARLLRLPRHILVEDSETGYRAWEIFA